MTSTSIVDIIKHYQKSIDRSLHDESRLIHCIGKLYRLPVSVQHLQETGIGRTVNGLRKYDGEVGVAAKALVSKWKNMVAAEESDTGEPEPHHQDDHHDGEEDEENCDESRLQVDEDRHSDDHHEDVEEDDDEEESRQLDEESDHQEELQPPPQQSHATNGHESDHRSERSSHRDSDRHRSSSSSSKHKSDRHGHHRSSSSKDESRSRDRHEKHRDGDKNQHHSSNSSSSKGHSSSPSTPSSSKKASRHEDEGKEKKDKHSSRKESSHVNEKESSHSSSKEKSSSSEKHHSKSKEGLNGFTTKDDGHKRKRTSEDEEETTAKKTKNEQPSESKSKSSSKSDSSSTSSKDKSSSKSSSSSGKSKEKDKKHSSEKKKKESSSKRKSDQSPDNVEDDDDDSFAGGSFADALAMIGMPSSSKKKSSSKSGADKIKTSSSGGSSSSMPPPPAKSDKQRSSSSRSSSSKRSTSPSSTASSSGYSSCSSTPSLLTQKPKLEPLPISEIVESLPMISPNYKPMPLNQTVMDCVFSSNGKPQKRPMTEEEALGHSMQSKNLRTKVYSGVKNCKGEVPTLYNMCIRLLQENIDLIDYTGGIPFDLLKPVLERATPEQLFTLENYNNYLMEDSDVLWEQHCKRNFRSQTRKIEECESWREMFIRCSEERESKLLSLTANIKQSQVEKLAPVRKTQLAYIDSAVKPPRSIISKQARYGTAQAPVVSPAARVAALKNATSNVAKAGDTRLKVAAGARDTAQAQVFHPTKPKKAPLMSKVMQSIKGFKGFRR